MKLKNLNSLIAGDLVYISCKVKGEVKKTLIQETKTKYDSKGEKYSALRVQDMWFDSRDGLLLTRNLGIVRNSYTINAF